MLAKAADETGPEWQRVHRGLEHLVEWQAKAILALARRSQPLGEPLPVDEALARTTPHDHWLHCFQGPEDRAQGVQEFLAEGLAAGSTVLYLASERELPALREEARRRGYGHAIASGRLTLLPAEGILDAVGGEPGQGVGAFSAALDTALRAGHPRVRIGSQPPAARASGEALVRWEGILHATARAYPVAVHCHYAHRAAPDRRSLLEAARRHNWLALGRKAYPLAFPPRTIP